MIKEHQLSVAIGIKLTKTEHEWLRLHQRARCRIVCIRRGMRPMQTVKVCTRQRHKASVLVGVWCDNAGVHVAAGVAEAAAAPIDGRASRRLQMLSRLIRSLGARLLITS